MAIPLFRLPILVIKLILESMGFIDIFLLTSASSKTKKIVKNLIRVRNHEMLIFLDKKYHFFNFQNISNPDLSEKIYTESRHRWSKNFFYLRIGTFDYVPSQFSPATNGIPILTTYWCNDIDHEKVLYNAFIELFRLPVRQISMDLNGVAFSTRKNWINWFNETSFVASLLVIVGKCRFSDFVWILESVKTENSLVINAEPTDYSETFGSYNVNFAFKAELISIGYGRWVKLDHLKSIEARTVNWKDLKVALNMKKLNIFFEREADPEVVLEGLELTNEDLMKPDDSLNQWSFKMANGDKCTVIYAEFDVDVPTFGFEFNVGN
ncbi:unnamed protein product [Caenorhabditis brenneri]